MLGCVLMNLNGGLASWQREPSNSVNLGIRLVAKPRLLFSYQHSLRIARSA